MDFLTLLVTSIALAADATAVSVAGGITCNTKTKLYLPALRAGLAFGIFQGGMTFIGWAIGLTFQDLIVSIDHWIAFILLAFLGLKMIKEAHSEEESSISLASFKTLIMLAIATSIDALAVGISFAVLQLNTSDIIQATLTIGTITFIFSLIGVYFGASLKGNTKFGAKINVAGGIILLLIGTKILIEHLFFS